MTEIKPYLDCYLVLFEGRPHTARFMNIKLWFLNIMIFIIFTLLLTLNAYGQGVSLNQTISEPESPIMNIDTYEINTISEENYSVLYRGIHNPMCDCYLGSDCPSGHACVGFSTCEFSQQVKNNDGFCEKPDERGDIWPEMDVQRDALNRNALCG